MTEHCTEVVTHNYSYLPTGPIHTTKPVIDHHHHTANILKIVVVVNLKLEIHRLENVPYSIATAVKDSAMLVHIWMT